MQLVNDLGQLMISILHTKTAVIHVNNCQQL